MKLRDAIEALNKVSTEKITTLTTRDGREIAKLPRVGREVLISGSQFKADVQVTPADLAWLCQEARLAMAPADALLGAALDTLKDVTAAA